MDPFVDNSEEISKPLQVLPSLVVHRKLTCSLESSGQRQVSVSKGIVELLKLIKPSRPLRAFSRGFDFEIDCLENFSTDATKCLC